MSFLISYILIFLLPSEVTDLDISDYKDCNLMVFLCMFPAINTFVAIYFIVCLLGYFLTLKK